MNTQIIKVDVNHLEQDKLNAAAQILRAGGTVAFPTETVYGLGADALNEAAVRKIFEAKGRPADNPLIVHIAELSEVDKLAAEVSDDAKKLMKAFWPGPLTIVLKKSSKVPDIITAGLDTVAVRFPSHPIAQRLIASAGVPVAAPSANISGKPSPTIGQHVIDDLYGRVDAIIDGGIAKVGLESTVIDMTEEKPVLLRPGGITLTQLSEVLGYVEVDSAVKEKIEKDSTPRSPGMKYTHYSPNADVIVVEGEVENVVHTINQLSKEKKAEGLKVGILAMDDTATRYAADYILSAGDAHNLETVAAKLFYLLREFDKLEVDIIFAQSVTDHGIGLAVRNRLNKAAGYHIIHV